MTLSTSPAVVRESHLEVRISGTAEAVWHALTDAIEDWWPQDFFVGGEPKKRSYQLEATPGGRMYESWEGGGGVLWGTVVAVNPGRQLQVLGSTFPNWGGPSLWFGTWNLEAKGGETRLQFSESTMGVISEAQALETEKGWKFLFGAALKAHVEGTPSPVWKE